MGRCDWQYPLALFLTRNAQVIWSAVDAGFDQRFVIACETYDPTWRFDLLSDLPAGTYDLRLAMVNAAGVPMVNRAIEGRDDAGRSIGNAGLEWR